MKRRETQVDINNIIKNSNSDAQAMVSFLENIDTNPSSWWTETQPVVNYIYNISGCPQVFTKEL